MNLIHDLYLNCNSGFGSFTSAICLSISVLLFYCLFIGYNIFVISAAVPWRDLPSLVCSE